MRTATSDHPANDDVWIVNGVRTPLAPPGALLEVQPSALLAGLVHALHKRVPALAAGEPWTVDGLLVGSLSASALAAGTVPRALARAEAPPGASAGQLEGTGAEAIRQAAAQLRSGDAGLLLAGGIHQPSGRAPLPAHGDIVGGIAMRLVSPRVAADVLAALAGVTAPAVLAHMQKQQGAGAPVAADGECEPVRDVNGLPILAADGLRVAASDAAESPWQNHHAVARQVHPQLGEIARVHTPATDPPPAEGACLLLLARADAARPLGLIPRARLAATASAGHLPLRGHEAAAYAFARALARAGWTRDEVEVLEVSSPFTGVPLALGAALGVDAARTNPDAGSWWFARAGAASSAIALMRLLRILENTCRRRGALLCAGAAGQATVLLVERGNDD